jgi:glycosyltransferase involved in cell wall biosynthesis
MTAAEITENTESVAVSIIINNYNYAEFLGRCIDSALAQSYADCEVIVVDDGSTDSSRRVIAGYGDRVTAVHQANGGQAAALNAGFARSRGAIVFFLDADDCLLPDAVATVVRHWDAGWAFCQFALELVDAKDNPLGLYPASLLMEGGAVWPRILTAGAHCYHVMPMSGLAFSRSVLTRLLPMPTETWRLCADAYLHYLAPAYGPVGVIDAVLGRYRSHGRNGWFIAESGRTANEAAVFRNRQLIDGALIQYLMALKQPAPAYRALERARDMVDRGAEPGWATAAERRSVAARAVGAAMLAKVPFRHRLLYAAGMSGVFLFGPWFPAVLDWNRYPPCRPAWLTAAIEALKGRDFDQRRWMATKPQPAPSALDETVDFGLGGQGASHQWYGWAEAEPGCTRSCGGKAALVFQLEDPHDDIIMRLDVSPSGTAVQKLSIFVGHTFIRAVHLAGLTVLEIRIPQAVSRQPLTVEFLMPQAGGHTGAIALHNVCFQVAKPTLIGRLPAISPGRPLTIPDPAVAAQLRRDGHEVSDDRLVLRDADRLTVVALCRGAEWSLCGWITGEAVGMATIEAGRLPAAEVLVRPEGWPLVLPLDPATMGSVGELELVVRLAGIDRLFLERLEVTRQPPSPPLPPGIPLQALPFASELLREWRWRTDLRDAFALNDAKGRLGYWYWCVTSGRQESRRIDAWVRDTGVAVLAGPSADVMQDGGVCITRIMHLAHAARADLQAAFDLSQPTGRAGLAEWFHCHGIGEMGVADLAFHPPPKPRLIIVDPSLRDGLGHHLNVAQALCAGAMKTGFACAVVAHVDVAASLPDGALLVPWFRCSIYDGFGRPEMDYRTEFAAALRGLPLPDLAGHDTLVFPTICGRELIEVATWYDGLPSERPWLIIALLFSPVWMPNGSDPTESTRYRHALVRLAAHAGKVRFITETDSISQQYLALAGTPSMVAALPTGVDILTRRKSPRAGGVVFGYLGYAKAEKGFLLLPEIVSRLTRRIGGARFIIQAASHRWDEPLCAALTAINTSDNVEVVFGAVSRERFAELLSSIDVLLLPYDPERYLGRGSGLLREGTAHGCRIVAPADMARAASHGTPFMSWSAQDIAEAAATAASTELRVGEQAR